MSRFNGESGRYKEIKPKDEHWVSRHEYHRNGETYEITGHWAKNPKKRK